MDDRRPIPLRVRRADASEWAATELVVAITLVAEGRATRIAITNIDVPDDLAGHGAALSQRAGVAFSVDRDPATGRRVMRIGPRLRP